MRECECGSLFCTRIRAQDGACVSVCRHLGVITLTASLSRAGSNFSWNCNRARRFWTLFRLRLHHSRLLLLSLCRWSRKGCHRHVLKSSCDRRVLKSGCHRRVLKSGCHRSEECEPVTTTTTAHVFAMKKTWRRINFAKWWRCSLPSCQTHTIHHPLTSLWTPSSSQWKQTNPPFALLASRNALFLAKTKASCSNM